MPRHETEVLERGTATPISATIIHRTGIQTPEGLEYVAVAMDGTNKPPPPGGGPPDGGGGDMTPLWRLDIPRDVQIAKWGLAAMLTLIGIFFWFVYLPDLKEVRRDISGINTNVAVQARSIGDIEKSLDRIEGKLDRDDQSEAGAGPGQAGGVRPGAGGGKRP
jgi:hypothetical protein